MLVVPVVSGSWDTTIATPEAELQHKYTVVVVGADTGLVILNLFTIDPMINSNKSYGIYFLSLKSELYAIPYDIEHVVTQHYSMK